MVLCLNNEVSPHVREEIDLAILLEECLCNHALAIIIIMKRVGGTLIITYDAFEILKV